MNTKFLTIAALAAGVACSFTACDDDDNDPDYTLDENGHVVISSIDCTTSNVQTWGGYMGVVANLLVKDATSLYTDWTESYTSSDVKGQSYATWFKAQPAKESVEAIIEGCKDIANEVGESKIGAPLSKWTDGKLGEAVLAVESWYSWHSRDDYSNNILSIRNSYYGSLDGKVAAKSLSALVKASDEALDTKIVNAINDAYNKILAIPQPFRDNIASAEAKAAQAACGELYDVLEGSKNKIEALDASALKEAVDNYVDEVVLPTYKNLKEKNEALYEAAKAFAQNPTDKAFEACANAWLDARQPWETSEAFLFGPVADKGLDPNMDSWPLDKDGITNIINSGKYDDLDWTGDFDEDNEEIASKQSVRGFHTLEFLIFKDGKARTIVK